MRPGGRAQRGGFTLAETVLALALLVLVGALVTPGVAALADRVNLDSACDALAAAADSARAQAQGQGRVTQLTARTSAEGVVQISAATLERDDSTTATGVDGSRLNDPGEAGRTGRGARVLADLPPRFRVSFEPPGAPEDEGAGDVSARASGDAQPDPRAPVCLAVFLPDGTVVAEKPLFVSDGVSCRVARLSSLTGGLVFADYVAPAEGADRDEDADAPAEKPMAPEAAPEPAPPAADQPRNDEDARGPVRGPGEVDDPENPDEGQE
jgi:type II secretory pathway pseudopilin PulG